jgi:O-antigen ligase
MTATLVAVPGRTADHPDAQRRRSRRFIVVVAAAATVVGVGVALGPLIATVTLGVVALVLSVRSTEIVLHLLVGSVFVESLSFGGSLRVGRVLALVALIVVAAHVVEGGRVRLPSWSWVPAALYGTWALASSFWARDFGAWATAMGQLGLALCVFLAFALLVGSEAVVRRVLRTLVLGAIAAAALGWLHTDALGRAEGLQGDANFFALYQAMAIPAALVLGRLSLRGARLGWYAATVPLAWSILTAQSRGGLATLVVVVAWIFVRRGDAFFPSRRRIVSVALGAVALAMLLDLTGAPVLERFTPEEVVADRGTARLDIWHVAWASFVRDPARGLGAGNFKTHSVELLEQEPGVQMDPYHRLLRGEGIEVHNVYLEALAELGVLGIVLYLTVLTATALMLRRLARASNPLAGGLAAMLVAFATGTLFLSTVNNKLLWAIIGTTAALSAASHRRAPAPVIP